MAWKTIWGTLKPILAAGAELLRRIARGFRNSDNYHLRRLLIGRGLTSPPPQGHRAAMGRVRLGSDRAP